MKKNEPNSSDIEQLKQIYSNIDGNKRIYAEKMLDQLQFMSETLADLQRQVREDGAVTTLKNGNGFNITQEHPAQRSYNQMLKNYNSTIKALVDLLPKNESQNDSLMDFLGGDSE